MTIARLAGIRACVFDAYGTLFDYGSAARACAAELGDKVEPVTRAWRDKQLQYTWLRAAQARHADFEQVTRDALDFTLDALGLARPGLGDRLIATYATLAAFPEVPDTLRRLRAAGMATAILSNGTPAMLARLVEAARIADCFDHLISVEEVGAFKPSPKVYQRAVDRLAVPAAAIAFQSSNAWDIHAASAFGMRTVWCNRTGQPRERLPGAPDVEVRTLADLPGILDIA